MNIDNLNLPSGLRINNTNNTKNNNNNIDINKNVANQSGSGKYNVDNKDFITKHFKNNLLKLEKDNILNLDNMLEVMN